MNDRMLAFTESPINGLLCERHVNHHSANWPRVNTFAKIHGRQTAHNIAECIGILHCGALQRPTRRQRLRQRQRQLLIARLVASLRTNPPDMKRSRIRVDKHAPVPSWQKNDWDFVDDDNLGRINDVVFGHATAFTIETLGAVIHQKTQWEVGLLD